LIKNFLSAKFIFDFVKNKIIIQATCGNSKNLITYEKVAVSLNNAK